MASTITMSRTEQMAFISPFEHLPITVRTGERRGGGPAASNNTSSSSEEETGCAHVDLTAFNTGCVYQGCRAVVDYLVIAGHLQHICRHEQLLHPNDQVTPISGRYSMCRSRNWDSRRRGCRRRSGRGRAFRVCRRQTGLWQQGNSPRPMFEQDTNSCPVVLPRNL